MLEALGDLEKFLYFEGPMPALIHCGLAHAQFETIHPFLDGNGSDPDSFEASPERPPSAFRASPEDTSLHFSHVSCPAGSLADPIDIPLIMRDALCRPNSAYWHSLSFSGRWTTGVRSRGSRSGKGRGTRWCRPWLNRIAQGRMP